jgi:hypothetical protein
VATFANVGRKLVRLGTKILVNGEKIVVGILAVSAAIALFACDRSDERGTPTPTEAASAAPGAGSPMTANAKLEKAVKTMFDADAQLRTANLSVSADVTKNEVTLSGTVDSEALRAKAVELAKSAHVGVIVNNKINVRPSQSNKTPAHATALV